MMSIKDPKRPKREKGRVNKKTEKENIFGERWREQNICFEYSAVSVQNMLSFHLLTKLIY